MARQRSNRRVSETERRRARQSRNKQKNRLLRILAAVGMGVLAVLIIAGLAIPSFGTGGQAGPTDFLERGGFLARPADGPGDLIADQGRQHLAGLDARNEPGYYNSSPPTSGAHSPTWERCGIFTEPVINEIQVHNLEHGFVNIQYNTDDAILIGQLEAAARQLPDWPNYYIFAPYPDMDETIALTAWNRILYLDAVDEDAMNEFADAYQARGPELARGCDAPGLMAQGAPDPTATPDPAADDAAEGEAGSPGAPAPTPEPGETAEAPGDAGSPGDGASSPDPATAPDPAATSTPAGGG